MRNQAGLKGGRVQWGGGPHWIVREGFTEEVAFERMTWGVVSYVGSMGNNHYILYTHEVSGSVLRALPGFTHLILTTHCKVSTSVITPHFQKAKPRHRVK